MNPVNQAERPAGPVRSGDTGQDELGSPWWGQEEADASSGHGVMAYLLPVLVAGVFCALLVHKGRTTAAVVLAVVVTALTIARLASPAFERRFAAGFERFGKAVGHVLRWLLLGVMFVFVFVPIYLLQLLLRVHPLGQPRGQRGGWVPKVAMGRPGPAKRGFGTEPATAPGAKTPKLVIALCVVAGLLVTDLALGTVLTGTGVMPPIDRGDLVAQVEQSLQRDMSNPPINVEPWAQQHGRDMAGFELQTNDYVPYIIRGDHEYASPTVNVTKDERLSYEPPVPAGVEPLQVGFFGGSVMFGVGQRDAHTIPSEFARIAEANGIPVQVHNYGFPAWVSWQEDEDMERLLADGHHWDQALYLDGFNEFDIQMTDYSPQPTHHSASTLNGLTQDFRALRATKPGWTDGLRELADSYRRNSGAFRLYDLLTGKKAGLPGADTVTPSTPEQQTDAALDIYGRSLERIKDLSADHEVPVTFFWQPRQAGWSPDILSRLPEGVVDLSNVFGGQDVFYDVVHTDEDSAHVMAQAMWDQVGPQLEAQWAARQAGSDPAAAPAGG